MCLLEEQHLRSNVEEHFGGRLELELHDFLKYIMIEHYEAKLIILQIDNGDNVMRCKCRSQNGTKCRTSIL
jgi:hypothetical protein